MSNAAYQHAAIGPVEAAAERMRVAERGVHDVIVGHAEHELVDADARKQIVFAEQTFVRGVIEIEDVAQMRIVIRDPHEHALVAMTRVDQAVRVELPHQCSSRSPHPPPSDAVEGSCYSPPRRASSSRRTVWSAGRPPLIM